MIVRAVWRTVLGIRLRPSGYADEGFRRAPVRAHEALAESPVAQFQGKEDAAMCAQRLLAGRGSLDGRGPERTQGLFQVMDMPREAGPARERRPQLGMESLVPSGPSSRVPMRQGCCGLADDRFQVSQEGWRCVLFQCAERIPLIHAPQFQQAIPFRRGFQRDREPTPRAREQQALNCQAVQGLAHGRPTDTKKGGDTHLRQSFSWKKSAREQGILERGVDPDAGRHRPGCAPALRVIG